MDTHTHTHTKKTRKGHRERGPEMQSPGEGKRRRPNTSRRSVEKEGRREINWRAESSCWQQVAMEMLRGGHVPQKRTARLNKNSTPVKQEQTYQTNESENCFGQQLQVSNTITLKQAII